jgi:hypothetical protein
MPQSRRVAIINFKEDFYTSDATWIPGRVRTRHEARQLLESLRAEYQSLSADERKQTKDFMSELFDCQRRFGPTSASLEQLRLDGGTGQ